MLSPQSVEKVCFISRFRKTPGEGFPLFRPFRTKNSPFLRFMKHKEFRRLRTATKDAVFGNCKPLKRLDLNFHNGFATSSRDADWHPLIIY